MSTENTAPSENVTAALAREMLGIPEPTAPAETEIEGPEAETEQADTAENEQVEQTDAADGEQDDAEQASKKKSRTTTDRINKLTADKRYWEREAAARQQELELLRAEVEKATKKPLTEEKTASKTEGVGKPDPAKYRWGEIDPQYISDLADYRADLKLSAFRQEQEEARQRSAAEQQQAQLRETATKVLEAGKAKFTDFEDVVLRSAEAGEFELTKEMFETAIETGHAPEILYHLAQNPTEALAVSRMNARQQALWFGRMEGKFSAAATPAAAPAPRKATQAPPPPQQVRGSARSSGVPDDTEDTRAFALKHFSR